uniref:dockerin type I domain-containing protein n=1 Tax=Apibacter mensalis TaxID=1586267 RepID=UPI0026EC2E72
ILSGLKNLESLYLYGSKIEGPIPESWGEMGKLKTLIISKNNISQLFSTIGNMISLTTLEVDGNKIQDIPKSLIQDQWSISNINFKNQTIKISELETGTNELIIKLPQICVFSTNNGSSNLNGKYIFNIYINNVRKGSTYSNNGMLYFKDIASWGLKYGDKVRVEQTEGYAQGTNIYYDKLTFGRQVEATEFEILKKFHSSTLGFLWKNKWDVSKNNLHIENWYGVGIKDGHIISISLPNNLLMGTIPEEISGLKYLEVLNLNSNEIEGELPISLGNLKKLKILNVLSNKISGNIPASLSESKELKKLILSNNNFSGNIPSIVLNELKEINELDLSNNSFTDIDHPLTFNNADIRNQESSKDEYLELKDDKIIVKLNKINLYDTKNSDFKAKNTFYLQANNLNISKSTAKDSLIIFSDINISEIPDNASIAIWQSDGSASGSHNRYKGIVRQSTTPVFDEEYRALVKLYQKTNGDQWKEKWDISSNNLHIQSWKGIIHNEGHIIEINLSDNNLNGIIPKEISDLPKLKSINLSSNRINGIEKIIPSNVTVILDRQTIDLGKLPLSDQTVIKDTSINRYDHKSQKFINQSYSITIGDFSKNITIPEKGIKLVDLIQRWNIPTNQELTLKQISGTTKYSNISYILTYKDGDSNMDGVVNVLDIQTILNYLQSIYPKYFNYSASDINKDSEINLLDVLLLVNQIQSNTLEKNPQVKNEVTSRNLASNLSIENNILYLENFDQTVSAFDIRLKGGLNENIISLLNPKDFTLHVSKNHELISILCFSTKDGLKVGKHPIAQIPSGSKIVSGLLSNEKAEEIVFQINDKLLNIEDTNEANDLSNKVTNTPNPFSEKTFIKYYLPDNALDVQLTLYDLQGRVVKVVKNLPVNQGNCEYTLFKSNLTPGVYIYFLEQKFRNYKKTYKRKILVTD